MKQRSILALAGAAASFALRLTPSAGAAIAVAFPLPQNPSGVSLVNGVDGFDFTPEVNLTVTAFGWYDHTGNGLVNAHPVGIYVTSTQTLAAPSANVTNASPLDAATNFRFEPVTPFVLTAGVTYTLVGYGSGPVFDPYVVNPSGGITFGEGFDYVRLRTSRANGLEFPTTAGTVGLTQDLFFGPNFAYTPAPEPHTCGLFMAGIGVAFSRRLRARRKDLNVAISR